jgi:heptosyltransferase-2
MPDPGSRTAGSGSRGVLILSPNWLGDAIMALPAIADVKRHFASAPLHVAARPTVADMFRLAPYVDEVVTLEWRGRMLRRDGWRRDLEVLRRAGCETAILLPNSFAAAWLTKGAGIAERWGYRTDMRRPLLTRSVRRPAGSVHQAEYYQHLVRELGIPTGPREAVLAVPAAAERAARKLLTARGWDEARPLVAIAPGAAYGKAKQWLPDHFARLAVMLSSARGAQCVLVGSAADAEATALIRTLAGAEAGASLIDLAGATTLETLAGVLTLARVCVSNDSGAMHLAAAVGAPVTALFGPTREYETSPLARRHSRAEVLINPVFCRPCMLRECPIDHRCMKGLAPDRVFSTVSEMMAGAR